MGDNCAVTTGNCLVTDGNGLVSAGNGPVSVLYLLLVGLEMGGGVLRSGGAGGEEALVLAGNRWFICVNSATEVGIKTKRQKPQSLSLFSASTPLNGPALACTICPLMNTTVPPSMVFP